MASKFSKLILHLREQKGMTQSEVAEKCGITYVAVGDWERGRRLPRVRNLKCLAAALGVAEAVLTEALYASDDAPDVLEASDPTAGAVRSIVRHAILNLEEFEGFGDLDEESREDVAEDVILAIQRARNRQRRRENLGGSGAGRGSGG